MLFSSKLAIGQQAFSVNLGISASFGSSLNRIGGFVKTNYTRNFGALNVEARFYYRLKGYGPAGAGYEGQLAAGFFIGSGAGLHRESSEEIYAYEQIPRVNAGGYTYRYYFDDLKTNQFTGTISMRFYGFAMLVENDALDPFGLSDNYRTGAFGLRYHSKQGVFELRNILWTGQTNGDGTFKVDADSSYPARHGYRNCRNGKYSQYSHGILSLHWHRNIGPNQWAQLGVGIDAEQIRNFLQNRLIHDMYFIPNKWVKVKNAHIPMLDENGDPYLFRAEQKIKPASLFVLLGLNEIGFY